MPGLVELDGAALGQAVMEVARSTFDEVGQVAGVAVTNQRGTTIVWDADTGDPIGPALSWQDLRTAGTCLELQAEGLRLAPERVCHQAGLAPRHLRPHPEPGPALRDPRHLGYMAANRRAGAHHRPE